MPDLEVRPARSEDREAVLAFCQQTWEWGDYYRIRLGRMVKQSAGQIIRRHHRWSTCWCNQYTHA